MTKTFFIFQTYVHLKSKRSKNYKLQNVHLEVTSLKPFSRVSNKSQSSKSLKD